MKSDQFISFKGIQESLQRNGEALRTVTFSGIAKYQDMFYLVGQFEHASKQVKSVLFALNPKQSAPDNIPSRNVFVLGKESYFSIQTPLTVSVISGKRGLLFPLGAGTPKQTVGLMFLPIDDEGNLKGSETALLGKGLGS